jgi:retron-type reverse transcriptase
MTQGVNSETMDGMSSPRIERIIASLKDRSYQPKPARRTYIAKKSDKSKKRPLGIPSGDDKLVQEVVRMILENIYEPTFADTSHGFRPKRSCHMTVYLSIYIIGKNTVII